MLAGALAWLDCSLEQVVEAGDHLIALGRVTSLDVGDDLDEGQVAEPLVFFQGGYGTVNG